MNKSLSLLYYTTWHVARQTDLIIACSKGNIEKCIYFLRVYFELENMTLHCYLTYQCLPDLAFNSNSDTQRNAT